MSSSVSFFRKFTALPGAAEVLAFAGALVFLFQSLHFARIQISILDEGLYLVKGFLFVTGKYIPYQVDGPWTKHTPLSYLIPGWVELIFGSGLRTGRYFSIALGLLILLGLWLIARRLGGRWWAAVMVWIVAISPAFANGYSMAVSQVLIACVLTWSLVLALDEKAPVWRLALAGVLAGLLILIRVNLAPVLPLLLGYIFWQFGKRAGLWATLAGTAVVVIGHLIYWPGILHTWAIWIPRSITPFLNPWRIDQLGVEIWDPAIGLQGRLDSLWDGIRFNFVPILALIVFGVLILQRKYWKNSFHYRTAVLLTALSAVLFLAHAWAALLKSYCVYCFAGYLEFFTPITILLILLVFESWKAGAAKWYSLFVLITLPILFSGIGYGASRVIGPWLIELPIPRFSAGRLQAGAVPLWGLLQNGLGLDYKISRWLVPTLAGAAVGILFILLVWFAFRSRWLTDRLGVGRKPASFGLFLAGAAITVGFILTPSPILTGSEDTVTAAGDKACQGDVLAAMEQAGEHLAKYIPPGALVYWQGSLSAVPLLAIPEARIFPAQLNDGYTYRVGGDTAALRKFGLWNDALKEQWREEADYIILLGRSYDAEWKSFLESGAFDELASSPRTDPCVENSVLRIFRRVSR